MESIHQPEFVPPAETEKMDCEEKAASMELREVVQNFDEIRQECLATRTLFEDPEFPAHNASVYYSKTPDKPIVWKRPTEITSNPKLFVDGFSRFDLTQGTLSDCWFVAAAANLAMNPNLFLQVVPEDQNFEVNYAGIFHFRFWRYGKWVDVVIDDRLPTQNGKLMYLHSPQNDEFWPALVEKAYAKLHGTYEALIEGMNFEAMEDFTGGIVELYNMNAIPPNLFNVLLNARERNSLIGCLLEGSSAKESKTPQGLVRWHCYSITDVKYADRKTSDTSEKVSLIRLRNPWGSSFEWNGKWSDGSPEWKSIPKCEREEMGLKFDHDGEYWMTFEDFKHYFTSIDICNLTPDSLMDPNPGEKKWEVSAFEGEWKRGVSAGGCRKFADTFWQNPQYRITLDRPDHEGEDRCTVIVSLIQKNRRAQKWKGIKKLHVGFVIYRLEDSETLANPLDKNFFDNCRDTQVVGSSEFRADRGINRRFQLTPGVYCIIPSTSQPHEEGKFLLRVFSDSKIHANMKDENEPVCMANVTDEVCYKIHEYTMYNCTINSFTKSPRSLLLGVSYPWQLEITLYTAVAIVSIWFWRIPRRIQTEIGYTLNYNRHVQKIHVTNSQYVRTLLGLDEYSA